MNHKIKDLKVHEACVLQAVADAETKLRKEQTKPHEVHSQLCDAYKEYYSEYIGKHVKVTTEYQGWREVTHHKVIEGYIESVKHDSYKGPVFCMAKVKKNGNKSLNYYSLYDSPAIDKVIKIEVVTKL